MTSSELRAAVESHLWYHTMELAPGVVTPGWFDLRSMVRKMPWPDVRGMRCLDVGTYDGFLAFELERRGAGEVVAIDIPDPAAWDWPPDVRASGGENLAKLAGPDKSKGFRIAADALGSRVTYRAVSVYDLDPSALGMFDVVVCGSLLLHLRDPLRALWAIRGVCGGWLLSSEQVDLSLTVAHRRRAVLSLEGVGALCQWMIPNVAGHRRMITASGFEVVRGTRPFVIPYGESHPARPRSPRSTAGRLVERVLTGGEGVPHAAVLARPRA
jgi:SAM-dependent methyltransferase